MSSVTGELWAGEPVWGVGPLAVIGQGREIAVDIGKDSLIGVGAERARGEGAVFFMAATFAVISACFCAMRAALDNCVSPPCFEEWVLLPAAGEFEPLGVS